MRNLISVALLVLFVASVTQAQTSCEQAAAGHEYLSRNGTCYILVDPPNDLKWVDAQQMCTRLFKGQLAYIENGDAVHAVTEWLKKASSLKDFWIGLLQVDTTLEPATGWAWVNTDHMFDHWANVNWHPNQPNDDNCPAQNCGKLCFDKDGEGMCDNDCTHGYASICQVKATFSATR